MTYQDILEECQEAYDLWIKGNKDFCSLQDRQLILLNQRFRSAINVLRPMKYEFWSTWKELKKLRKLSRVEMKLRVIPKKAVPEDCVGNQYQWPGYSRLSQLTTE